MRIPSYMYGSCSPSLYPLSNTNRPKPFGATQDGAILKFESSIPLHLKKKLSYTLECSKFRRGGKNSNSFLYFLKVKRGLLFFVTMDCIDPNAPISFVTNLKLGPLRPWMRLTATWAFYFLCKQTGKSRPTTRSARHKSARILAKDSWQFWTREGRCRNEFLELVLVFVVSFIATRKLLNELFGPPRKPKGCRCAHTCPKCQAWTKYVKENAPPCPGNREDFYFDDWEGYWQPLQKR